MDDFVILTDSCCDMTARMAADLELEVLPLSLNMEDRVYHNYLDGREIGFQDFYARLRAGAWRPPPPSAWACLMSYAEDSG